MSEEAIGGMAKAQSARSSAQSSAQSSATPSLSAAQAHPCPTSLAWYVRRSPLPQVLSSFTFRAQSSATSQGSRTLTMVLVTEESLMPIRPLGGQPSQATKFERVADIAEPV